MKIGFLLHYTRNVLLSTFVFMVVRTWFWNPDQWCIYISVSNSTLNFTVPSLSSSGFQNVSFSTRNSSLCKDKDKRVMCKSASLPFENILIDLQDQRCGSVCACVRVCVLNPSVQFPTRKCLDKSVMMQQSLTDFMTLILQLLFTTWFSFLFKNVQKKWTWHINDWLSGVGNQGTLYLYNSWVCSNSKINMIL